MSTNKQALREAAEKAISEEGETWWSEDQLAIDYGLALHKADAKFIAAANPATVLALLDELEAADELNKHLELAIRKAEGCSEALRRKAEAAEKRVVELESRQVNEEVSDEELNSALQLHRLKVDGHSQLSDAFRAGFKYARRTAGITVKGDS